MPCRAGAVEEVNPKVMREQLGMKNDVPRPGPPPGAPSGLPGLRIIAGAHRGRRLVAPEGDRTRPTADRVRQALFDMLWHAPWAGRERIEGARVLDAFAGTGALGLEALSRGAAQASFIENDRAALAALRANIAGCKEEARCNALAADALKPPRAQGPAGLSSSTRPTGKG